MADETPDIRVVIGAGGKAVGADEVQGPLDVSEPLIIIPENTTDVVLTPVENESSPPDHLAVLRGSNDMLMPFRAVTQLSNGKVKHLDPSVDQERMSFLGITQNGASVGKKAIIITQGILHTTGLDPWLIGPVHSTADGVLTQDLTSHTFQVATAITPTDLKIGISTASSTSAASTTIWQPPQALDTWVISHSLQRYPSVTVLDSAKNVIFADVEYLDINTVQVKFAYPTDGWAYLV